MQMQKTKFEILNKVDIDILKDILIYNYYQNIQIMYINIVYFKKIKCFESHEEGFSFKIATANAK